MVKFQKFGVIVQTDLIDVMQGSHETLMDAHFQQTSVGDRNIWGVFWLFPVLFFLSYACFHYILTEEGLSWIMLHMIFEVFLYTES